MACEREYGIVPRHARSIVAHANQLAAAVLHHDVNGCRTGVQSILDELLHHGGRALDDLTSRDLVSHGAGKDRDASGHPRILVLPRRDMGCREAAGPRERARAPGWSWRAARRTSPASSAESP